jgi:hypothetical protein
MDRNGHPLRNVAPSCPCGCEAKPTQPPPKYLDYDVPLDWDFDPLENEQAYPNLRATSAPDSTEYIKTFFDSLLPYVVQYKTLPPTIKGLTDIYTLKNLLRLHKQQCMYCSQMLHRETGKCSLLVIVLSLGYAFYKEYDKGHLLVETFEELYNQYKTHTYHLKPSQYRVTNLKKIERFDKVLRKNRFMCQFDDYHSKLNDKPPAETHATDIDDEYERRELEGYYCL